MRIKGLLITLFTLSILCAQAQKISPESRELQNYIPDNAVIAHRGTVYWAPELTEASFRWARNAGADYVELDVQRSKDGVLIIMHDITFKRTTDVAVKFPGRENDPVSSFTYKEISQLDAGKIFNQKNKEQGRSSFENLDVLVFEDVFRIAEGKKIRRNPDGSRIFHLDENGQYHFEYEKDPGDNGHRPGVYIETKKPDLNPGIEEQIYNELTRMNWNPLEGEKIRENEPFYLKGLVNIGNTRGKILLQTFSREGMLELKRVFKGEVLTSFLILNNTPDEFKKVEVMDEIVAFTLECGAPFIGTNISDTNDGLPPQFAKRIHAAGIKINAYSFNTTEQMIKYFGQGKGKKATPLLDGMITNRADLTIRFYSEHKVRKPGIPVEPQQILEDLGYN